jgi:transketolase
LALAAQAKLENEKIPTRVVSMPSWEIFSEQPDSYREEVLPKNIKARVSIEALSGFGWEKWVGLEGLVIGINSFGASAPAPILFEKFGFTTDNIVQKSKQLLS